MIKKTPGIKTQKIKESPFKIPEGLWMRCDSCHSILQQKQVEENLGVCPECAFHFKISVRSRIENFCDSGSFEELDTDLIPQDHLKFYDSKPYPDRLRQAQNQSGSQEAFVSGRAKLFGRPLQLGLFDFSFMGGSMGTIVGEKAARLFDRACQEKTPAVIFHSSGGARMQEGLLSLMQMAKTVAARSCLQELALPYISIMTHPTTGGVAASFAMLGDVHLAEPKALICFAGPRVIEQTIKQKLPEGFQRAEFLLTHGMLDQVVHRKDLRKIVDRYLRYLC